jgi:beta-galactosidase
MTRAHLVGILPTHVLFGALGVVVLITATLVIQGEDETGPRAPDPFVARDVASLPPTLDVTDHGVPVVAGDVLPSLEWQPDRHRVDLGGTWRSQRVEADHELSLTDRARSLPEIEQRAGGRQNPGYDDSGWSRHPVPSPENELHGDDPPEEYQGGVWYRRTVDVPAPADRERVRLVLAAVSSIADVWVDGRWVGYHEGGYTPFVVDVTDAMRERPGPLTISVRIDNPPLGPYAGTVPAQTVDWVNYTGILQEVYLEYVPAGGIARLDAVPRALPGIDPRERVGLDVTVVAGPDLAPENVTLQLAHADVRPELLTARRPADLAGAVAAAEETGRTVERASGHTVVRVTLEVARPWLWSPEAPALYVLTASIPGDRYATQVGLRTVGVAADGPQVLLNGRAARFVGLNRHEEWPDTGRTTTDLDRLAADLSRIRDTGATLLRTAHYPNSAMTYLLADRIGLAVIEEIPMWWTDAYAFADQERRRIADQMWREMIFRDRNRPSVLAWSAVNEARAQNARAAYLNRLVRDLRLRYPDGRLVTQSAAADRPGADDPSRHQVDVAGYTVYAGTFDDDAPDGVTRRVAGFLADVHAADPRQPVWVTEFGAYAGPRDAKADRQAELFDAVWSALKSDPHLSGAAWWSAADNFTPIAGVNTFGLQPMDGRGRRPVAAKLRAAFQAAPPVTSGPLLAAREPFVPDPLPAPDHPRPAPGTLSDFAAADPAEPAGGARLETRDGALVLHRTGEKPSAAVYLYGRPVDLSASTRLCLAVLDPDGGAGLKFELRDTNGATTDVTATEPTAPGAAEPRCASLADDRDARIDLTRVDLVTVTLQDASSEQITIDDLTVF